MVLQICLNLTDERIGIPMTEILDPKTCSIDRLVTVPSDVANVLEGRKKATRRNGRYADPGETMILGGQSFEVTRVYQQSLGEMTDEDAQSEGFESMEAYKTYILSMHKGMPWVPQVKVWVHEFRPISS